MLQAFDISYSLHEAGHAGSHEDGHEDGHQGVNGDSGADLEPFEPAMLGATLSFFFISLEP